MDKDLLGKVALSPRLQLVEVHYELPNPDTPPFKYFGAFWRFFALEDQNVDCFVTRDLDDLLSQEGMAHTLEWVESNFLCHKQSEKQDQFLCNAGWMGFKKGCIGTNVWVMHSAYAASCMDDGYGVDERWLSAYLYPKLVGMVGIPHHRPFLSGSMAKTDTWTKKLEFKWKQILHKHTTNFVPHYSIWFRQTSTDDNMGDLGDFWEEIEGPPGLHVDMTM